MAVADSAQKLKRALNRMIRNNIHVQTVWAKVKSVDWDKKTMVATGVVYELDYYDVLLGLGSVYIKPVVGKLCLLGVIENHTAATHLIHAEEVADIAIVVTEELTVAASDLKFDADSTVFNGGANGGLVINNKLDTNLSKIKEYVKELETQLDVIVTAVDGLTGSNGAMIADFQASMALQNMNFKDMENTKVKH